MNDITQLKHANAENSKHMSDVYAIPLVVERGWTANNFTEHNEVYKNLESLCQIRQLTLDTLQKLKNDELGYIIGRGEIHDNIKESTAPNGEIVTVNAKVAKLRGNAQRAAFVLESRERKRLQWMTWGLTLVSSVSVLAIGHFLLGG